MPEISTIPAAALTSYSILPRYYLTLAIAVLCVAVVAMFVPSRVGLGIRAVREDEAAAEASGVGAFRHKLLALAALDGSGRTCRRRLRLLPCQLLPAACFFSGVDVSMPC